MRIIARVLAVLVIACRAPTAPEDRLPSGVGAWLIDDSWFVRLEAGYSCGLPYRVPERDTAEEAMSYCRALLGLAFPPEAP